MRITKSSLFLSSNFEILQNFTINENYNQLKVKRGNQRSTVQSHIYIHVHVQKRNERNGHLRVHYYNFHNLGDTS